MCVGRGGGGRGQYCRAHRSERYGERGPTNTGPAARGATGRGFGAHRVQTPVGLHVCVAVAEPGAVLLPVQEADATDDAVAVAVQVPQATVAVAEDVGEADPVAVRVGRALGLGVGEGALGVGLPAESGQTRAHKRPRAELADGPQGLGKMGKCKNGGKMGGGWGKWGEMGGKGGKGGGEWGEMGGKGGGEWGEMGGKGGERGGKGGERGGDGKKLPRKKNQKCRNVEMQKCREMCEIGWKWERNRRKMGQLGTNSPSFPNPLISFFHSLATFPLLDWPKARRKFCPITSGGGVSEGGGWVVSGPSHPPHPPEMLSCSAKLSPWSSLCPLGAPLQDKPNRIVEVRPLVTTSWVWG